MKKKNSKIEENNNTIEIKEEEQETSINLVEDENKIKNFNANTSIPTETIEVEKSINEEDVDVVVADKINSDIDSDKFSKKIDLLKDFKKNKNLIDKKSVFRTSLFKKYNNLNSDDFIYEEKKFFNFENFLRVIIALVFCFSVIAILVLYYADLDKLDILHVVSSKIENEQNEKVSTLNNSMNKIKLLNEQNMLLSDTNLNLIYKFDAVKDEEDKKLGDNSNAPTPGTIDEENPFSPMNSVAGQIFTKLSTKYNMYLNDIYNLSDTRPVNIVRQYKFDGRSILGSYNPEESSHVKNKPMTYFINNFTNVNFDYYDGDGNKIDEYNNIKDIMSMASVYTYYHNVYDYNTFLKYCYNLYDKSMTYEPSISPVYYCSGCMNTTDNDLIIGTHSQIVDLNKINSKLNEHNTGTYFDDGSLGTIQKIDLNKIDVNSDTYEDYVSDIVSGNSVGDKYNYCPGHIDLNIKLKILTIDDVNGLFSIDDIGNRGLNWTVHWHGWDIEKRAKAIALSNKDWELEYGLSVSYMNNLVPLTQEEINFYLNRLDKDLSKNRVKVIETALKSVSKIPYYYGGKPNSAGYTKNNFGTRVKPDYKGRILKGLDCSGWINWVYWTTFNKKIIKSEGTGKLATEGTRIRRSELKPGDIIVRPSYDSHVMMFLEWAPEGKMKVIHENGSMNNVTIGTFEAYYPYYRRILTE